MGSLFQGSPQTATSYATSTTETPKWMQDAIYNQIQMAQNVANKPYEAYQMPTVAELSPMQQQAYSEVQKNQGMWQPAFDQAQYGTFGVAQAPGGTQAAQPYMQQGLATNAAQAAQPYLDTQSGALQGMNYASSVNALSPYASQATQMSGLTAAQPYIDTAYSGMKEAGAIDTATGLQQAQSQYLRPELVDQALSAGQTAYGRAAQQDIVGAAQPYLNRAAQQDIVGAAQPYMSQAGSTTAEALSERALAAANPYLQSAAQTSASQVGQYMSPYQEGVLDVIAKQGARNLRENILPSVSDSFIKAGQFGSSRMGEFGSRAVRDTQEAVLNQQAQAAQQGYGQSLAAAQADLARQGQLAGTVGSISGADLSRILQGGAQYGNLGQTAGQLTAQQMQNLTNLGQTSGQLTGQQMSNLTNLGQAQTSAGQAQQQFGLNAAQAAQAAQAADAARQLQAAQAQAQLGQTVGGLTQAQQNVLLSGGQALSAAEQQANAQRLQGAAQYGNIAQTAGGLEQAQQQAYMNAASQIGQLTNADLNRQLSAYNQAAGMAQAGQGMRTADVAALETAGLSQQAQRQRELDAAQAQFYNEQNYPKQQLDWLSTQVRGMAPITPQTQTQSGTTTGATYSPSPLSQLATGLYTYKGLQSLG